MLGTFGVKEVIVNRRIESIHHVPVKPFIHAKCLDDLDIAVSQHVLQPGAVKSTFFPMQLNRLETIPPHSRFHLTDVSIDEYTGFAYTLQLRRPTGVQVTGKTLRARVKNKTDIVGTQSQHVPDVLRIFQAAYLDF